MSKTKHVDLLDLATLFAKRKMTVLKLVLVMTILGLVVALLWPKNYRSELTYIVTDSNSINLSSGGLLSGIANLSMGSSNISAEQSLIILRGTELKDKVIEEFNLSEVYGEEIQEGLRKKLENNLEIEEFREGGIGFNSIIATSFAVLDEEPERAFNMTRFIYQQLDSTVKSLNKKNIEGGYIMLKNRLDQNRMDLQEAEDSLVSFQKKYGILEVEEQAKAMIENIASVKSELVQLEVQIGYIEKVFGQDNAKLNELEIRKEELQKKYDELMDAESEAEAEFNIYRSMAEMPDLFLEYLRRYREVEVQQEIFKVLYPQFEQQKLNYQDINSGLRVIDPANYPTYKHSPKRAYIVLGFMLFGLFLSVIIILFRKWKEDIRQKETDDFDRYQDFLSALKFKND